MPFANVQAAREANVVVINNFSLPGDESAAAVAALPAELQRTGRMRVLFAGNVGRFQGLETAVDAMARLAAAAVMTWSW